MRYFFKKPKPADSASKQATPPAAPSYAEYDKGIQVLGHINRFGWLTVSQLALLLYGECPANPRAPAFKNTRKILARLYESKMLFVRVLPNNSRAYLLTEAGADHFKKTTGMRAIRGDNILTTHPVLDRKTGRPKGRKSSSPSWIHRWVANEFIIRNDMEHGLSEVEIYRKNAPFPKEFDDMTGIAKRTRSWKGKAPDALLIREENGIKYLTWVEVENAKRRSGGRFDSDTGNNRGGLQSLAVWLANALKEDIIFGKVRVEKVVFVVVTSEETPHRLHRFMWPIYSALDDFLNEWYPGEYDKKKEVYDKVFIEQYVLGSGPRLLEMVQKIDGCLVNTLSNLAVHFANELMDGDDKGKPRTDGIIKV